MKNNDIEPERQLEVWVNGSYCSAYDLYDDLQDQVDPELAHGDYMQNLLATDWSKVKCLEMLLFELPTNTYFLKKFLKQSSQLWPKHVQLELKKELALKDFKRFINLFDRGKIKCPKVEFISFKIDIDDDNKDKDSFVQTVCDFLQKYDHIKKVSIHFTGEFPKNLLNKIPNHIEELNLLQRSMWPKRKHIDIKIDNDIPFSKIVRLETINCDQATINIVKNNTTFVKRKDPIKIKVTQSHIPFASLQKVPFKMEVAQFENLDTQVPTEIKASKNSTQKTIIHAYDLLDYPKSNLLTKRKFISKEEKLDEEELANIIEVEELANIIRNDINSTKLVLTETKWYLSEPKTQKVENKYTQCNLFDPPQDEVAKMGDYLDYDFQQ